MISIKLLPIYIRNCSILQISYNICCSIQTREAEELGKTLLFEGDVSDVHKLFDGLHVFHIGGYEGGDVQWCHALVHGYLSSLEKKKKKVEYI